jgi:GDP-4-dehydro-6-deoxy-D-mannose reductase
VKAPVLVTGAAGFVGRHLLASLTADQTNVVAWRRPGSTAASGDSSHVRWMDVDLLDRQRVASAIDEVRPAAIYHLAGFANVGRAWSHPREAFENNVLGTHYLFDALRAVDLRPRVLVTLSAAVYRHQTRALVEDDVLEPLNPYATSKLAQEMVAAAAFAEDGIPALLARAFNHTGPGQPQGFVAPDIARQIALIEAGRKAAELSLGNLDAARDLADVRDVVRAYRAMMASARPGVPYNVCAGNPVSVRTLVRTLVSAANVPVRIVQDPAKLRPNDVPLVLGDHARLTADTGWTPQFPLEQTLTDVLNDWRDIVAREPR